MGGVLDELYKMLISSDENYRMECCWTISNIFGCNNGDDIFSLVTNHPIFDEMIHRLAIDDFKVSF